MLSYSEALERILSCVPQSRPKRIPLDEAAGRMLAENLVADRDVPPFDKALMDGYAACSIDTAQAPVELRVVDRVAAGDSRLPTMDRGEAIRIMTGAPLPAGADCVQMIEKTHLTGANRIVILEPVEAGRNVAGKGSEVLRGDVVIQAGSQLTPARIGVMATFGWSQAVAFENPRVVIFSTGSELVPLDEVPANGQIYESNSWMLQAQCRRLGISAERGGVLRDDVRAIGQALGGCADADLIVFSGGVSVGDFDLVHQTLSGAGVEPLLHKVAIRPGKPIWFGRLEHRLFFGLPGNPVSAFVTFELFVRPVIRRLQGHVTTELPRVVARLVRPIQYTGDRLYFKPARTYWVDRGFECEPLETAGSGDLTGFSRANSLLVVKERTGMLEPSALVEVLLLETENFCG